VSTLGRFATVLRMKIITGALVGLILLTGCGSPDRAEVDWSNYAPNVKVVIDDLAAQGDCRGLQKQFDQAEANDDAQRARTGSGSAGLMTYIDEKLKAAGCYT
jgi:major membrane immunogen (membrane-anchored lipoprotein)